MIVSDLPLRVSVFPAVNAVATSTWRLIQFAGRLQHTVTNDLGFDSLRRETPQQGIIGVGANCVLSRGARLPERVGQYDAANEVLGAPGLGFVVLRIHELGGEPVEQFGMARRCARFAKIGGCCDDARAEEMMPHAVYINSCRKRMFGAGDPLSESLPSLGIRRARVQAKITIEDGEASWHDFTCRILRAPAAEHTGDNRIPKTTDKTVARTFLIERSDEFVQPHRGLLQRGSLVQSGPCYPLAGNLAPSAIGLLRRDTIAGELICRAVCDVVGLKIGFAIAREA